MANDETPQITVQDARTDIPKRSFSRHLIDELFFSAQPSLMRAVGVEKALILQHIQFMLTNPKCGTEIENERWVWNTYEDWAEEFKHVWAAKTIADHIRFLQNDLGVLVCKRVQTRPGYFTKYYRIDHKRLEEVIATPPDMRPRYRRKAKEQHTDLGRSDLPQTVTPALPHVVNTLPTANGTLILESINKEPRDYLPTENLNTSSDAPSPSIGSRKRSPKTTTTHPPQARKRDELFDYFASQYELARGFKYRVVGGDFPQLAKLRKAHAMDGDEIEMGDWQRAVANYLASERTKESVRDLATQYNAFLASVRDKYGNAIQPGMEKQNERRSFEENRYGLVAAAFMVPVGQPVRSGTARANSEALIEGGDADWDNAAAAEHGRGTTRLLGGSVGEGADSSDVLVGAICEGVE